MKKFGISIIICTYDRKSQVSKAIKKVLGQKIKNYNVEIIVIDQGKSNLVTNTLRKIKIKKIPNDMKIRHIKQKGSGVARARNLGILKAKNEIIVYIDDDIVPVGHDWLINIHRTFQNKKVKIACGKIFPNKPLPKYLSKYQHLFACFNHGRKSKFLSLCSFIPTSHLMIRKKLIKKLGGFRSNLGRTKKTLMSGEDNELTYAIGQLGIKPYYNPQLQAIHFISTNRKSKKFLLRRLFWQGVTDIMLDHYYDRNKNNFLPKIILSLLESLARLISQKIKNGPYFFHHLTKLYYLTGQLYGFAKRILINDSVKRPLDIYKHI